MPWQVLRLVLNPTTFRIAEAAVRKGSSGLYLTSALELPNQVAPPGGSARRRARKRVPEWHALRTRLIQPSKTHCLQATLVLDHLGSAVYVLNPDGSTLRILGGGSQGSSDGDEDTAKFQGCITVVPLARPA